MGSFSFPLGDTDFTLGFLVGAGFSVSRQLGLGLSLGLGPGRLSALQVIFLLRKLGPMSILFSFALFSLGRFKLTVLSFFIFLWGGSVLVVWCSSFAREAKWTLLVNTREVVARLIRLAVFAGSLNRF